MAHAALRERLGDLPAALLLEVPLHEVPEGHGPVRIRVHLPPQPARQRVTKAFSGALPHLPTRPPTEAEARRSWTDASD